MVDQGDRATGTGEFGTAGAVVVFVQAALAIGSDPGVEAVVAATQDINVPVGGGHFLL